MSDVEKQWNMHIFRQNILVFILPENFHFIRFNYLTRRRAIRVLLSRRSRQRERLSASMLSICLFVCLSVAKMQKNAIF